MQVADTTPGGQAPVTFTYDANGQRVTKASGSGTAIYAADAFGQVVAEYSTAATAQVACATCFFTADHLGSTRLVTDANAHVVSRRDYLPFGEQIDPWIGPRNQQWNDNDNASHKFTGQQRVAETDFEWRHRGRIRRGGIMRRRWTHHDNPPNLVGWVLLFVGVVLIVWAALTARIS